MAAAGVSEAMTTRGDDRVVIGEVVKARGLRGEVLVKSLSDVDGRFDALTGAFLHDGEGDYTWFDTEQVRPHREMYIVKFCTVDDRLAARDRLVGRTLEIPRDQSPPAGEHENYYYDLIGLAVHREDGPLLGQLESIIETGANDVYLVRGAEGQEILIPATREVVVAVDVEGGRMSIRPLPGLLPEEDSQV